MSALGIKPREGCRFDLVALGEVMLRLDPGDGRVATTRSFRVWEGGGEYNVARGLRRCFGLDTAIVTALVDNPVGRLVEDLVLQGGVDTSHLRWMPFDGIGRAARNGLNFTERGFGVRGAVGCSDRGHTAVSQLAPGDVDWEQIFGAQGARWFHCGGIFAALSETTSTLALEAMASARRHGTVVSYDLNFRPSLWQERGREAAVEINRELVRHVDVLFGNEEDFIAALGFEAGAGDEGFRDLSVEAYGELLERVVDSFPDLKAVASTLRVVRSATQNEWGAICVYGGRRYVSPLEDVEIYDRVGGGDSFVSGFVYALLAGLGQQEAVEYGAAHGALAMTTPGDTSTATLAEVERLVAGGGARVRR